MAERLASWIWPGVWLYITVDAGGAVQKFTVDNESDLTIQVTYDFLGEGRMFLAYGGTTVQHMVNAANEGDVTHFGVSSYAYPAFVRLVQAALAIPPASGSIRILAASLAVPAGG